MIIRAVVQPGEEPAIRLAADYIAASLGTVSATPRDVCCIFSPDLNGLPDTGTNSIVITSLLGEVDSYAEPWPQAEQRLRAAYAALASRGNAVIFICTVLRHVRPDRDADSVEARRIRIRRLNLLAAELSRELGIFVIDLDRTLADTGARALDTDYRLGGAHAAQSAAKCVALTLLSAGLDDFIPFEEQDAAAAIIAAYEVSRALPAGTRMELMRGKAISMQAGRRVQNVVPIRRVARSDQAGWILRSVLNRQISVGEAYSQLVQSIAHHGLRSSAAVLASAVAGLLKSRLRTGR